MDELERKAVADKVLVERSLEAREAFDELVKRHYGMVYSVAYGHVGQREAAEEVAQETFLRAYLNLETLKEPAAFSGWLMRIARNLAENWRVRGQTRSQLAAMVPLEAMVTEPADERVVSARDKAAAEQESRAVHAAIAKLPAPDRELVTMHFLEGISQSELARRLGVYPSTVGRQLERALGFLRKELGSVFPRTAEAVQPSRGAASRVALLIAAASSLPLSAKAALASAAAASGFIAGVAGGSVTGGVCGSAGTIGSSSGSASLTHGGTKMLIGGSLAAVTIGLGVLLNVLSGGIVPSINMAGTPPGTAGHGRTTRVIAAVADQPARIQPAATMDVQPTAPEPQELLGSREAERAKITSLNPDNIAHDSFASASHMLMNWGEHGDSVEWEAEFDSVQSDLKLGIRYAYHQVDYIRQTQPANPHTIHLYVDDQGPISIPMNDTRGWNWFSVASVSLPPMDPGKHNFKIVSPSKSNGSNLDCFTFYRGDIDMHTPSPLRPSVLHETSGTFKILASPSAELPVRAEAVSKTFEQLRKLMTEDFGREPQPDILVHFADLTNWNDSHGRAVKNQHGIYLLGDGQLNRADWCWALAEYYGDHRVPRWFRDSSSRVNGLLDWLPAIDESTTTSEDAMAVSIVDEARKLLADPEAQTSRVEVVHAAVRSKFGDDVFRKFWRLIRDDAPLPGQPAAPHDKMGVMAFMTSAAGSDVTPLYRQWKGFADEGPVDPLVVTDVTTRMEQ